MDGSTIAEVAVLPDPGSDWHLLERLGCAARVRQRAVTAQGGRVDWRRVLWCRERAPQLQDVLDGWSGYSPICVPVYVCPSGHPRTGAPTRTQSSGASNVII